MDRRYTIKIASRLTGITPDTIRVWERRYGAVDPGREDNGRRFYTDEDIHRLSLMKKACDLGAPIREVARLSQPDLESWVNGRPKQSAALMDRSEGAGRESEERELIDGILAAVERYDADEVDRLLNCAAIALAPEDLIRRALFPLLKAVGDRWFENRLTVAQEHFLSARLRSLTGGLMRAYPRRREVGSICFATITGERHEFGILLSCWLATIRGWRCHYLGPDLPPAEIAEAVTASRSKIIALSAVYSDRIEILERQTRQLRALVHPTVEIWLGGAAAGELKARVNDLDQFHVSDLDSFTQRLETRDDASQTAGAPYGL